MVKRENTTGILSYAHQQEGTTVEDNIGVVVPRMEKWEVSKENVKPIKEGRCPEELVNAFDESKTMLEKKQQLDSMMKYLE